MGNREVPHAFEKKGARGGNMVSPATGSRRRTVLAGPGFDIVWFLVLDPLYGYIFFSRLNGMSDVAEASCG